MRASIGFDLHVVTRRLGACFQASSLLALIGRGESAPWSGAFQEIIPVFSMSVAYRPRDLIAELTVPGLAAFVRTVTFCPAPISQPLDEYVGHQHSRSAFARHRMSNERAEEFDEALRRILEPYAAGGRVTYQFSAPVIFMRVTANIG